MPHTNENEPLFPLGRVVATPGAIEALRPISALVPRLLAAHQHGVWGDLSEEDRAANDLAVREGARIISTYPLPNGVRIWVITEADRRFTTLLIPEEY